MNEDGQGIGSGKRQKPNAISIKHFAKSGKPGDENSEQQDIPKESIQAEEMFSGYDLKLGGNGKNGDERDAEFERF